MHLQTMLPNLVAKLPPCRRPGKSPLRMSEPRRGLCRIGTLWVCGWLALAAGWLSLPVISVWGQATGDRRPPRAQPPQLDPKQFEGIFFARVSEQLRGEFPARGAAAAVSPASGAATFGGDVVPRSQPAMAADRSTAPVFDAAEATAWPQRRLRGEVAWSELIDAASLEDTVKQSKGRLDELVASASRFAGGGYLEARREFYRLAIAFSVIAEYPREVRWQSSAAVAAARLTRMGAACRVGSTQLHSQARRQLQELDDLLNGLKWEQQPGEELAAEDWTTDRGMLMQMMEYDLRNILLPTVAAPQRMQAESDEASVAAQWLAVLGQVLLKSGMQDADDEDYRSWCRALIDQARQTAAGIQRSEQPAARESAGRIDQVCSQCHNDYR
jgi:hypothetical protein